MHKDRMRGRRSHQRAVDLIGGQRGDALLPHRDRLAHGYPNVGVDHVGIGDRLCRIGAKINDGAGLCGDLAALCRQRGVRKICLGRASGEVHAHLGTAHHQGIAHVVARVPHVDQMNVPQRAEMLLYREEVR